MLKDDIWRTAIISVGGWIALSVAHLPAIEQKLDDYIISTDNRLVRLEDSIKNFNNSN